MPRHVVVESCIHEAGPESKSNFSMILLSADVLFLISFLRSFRDAPKPQKVARSYLHTYLGPALWNRENSAVLLSIVREINPVFPRD